MYKFVRKLALPATLILALTACASFGDRDLPRCSGHDRRPLNSDLWGWETSSPASGEDVAPAVPAVLGYAPVRAQRPPGTEVIEATIPEEPPGWNVAASKEPCVEVQ